jgi:hypothetical protein
LSITPMRAGALPPGRTAVACKASMYLV